MELQPRTAVVIAQRAQPPSLDRLGPLEPRFGNSVQAITIQRGHTDEALGRRVAGDHAVAHAVHVRPRRSARRRTRRRRRPAQGGPARLAGVQRLERVPVLHLGRHHPPASGSPSTSTSTTRLRPTTPLGASYPRGPRTRRCRLPPACRRSPPSAGRLPALRRRRRATSRSRASNRPSSSQRRNQPIHGPPRRPACSRGAPGPAHPQVPRGRADHPPGPGRPPAPRRVGPPRPAPRPPPPRAPPPAPSGPARAAPGAPPSTSRRRRSHPRRSCAPSETPRSGGTAGGVRREAQHPGALW